MPTLDAATLSACLAECDEYALAIAETEAKERRHNRTFELTNRARILEGKALAVRTLRARLERMK